MKITFEFATQDDCLDRMVPSDLRVLVAQRDRLQARVAAQQSALNSICTCSWGAAEFFDVGKAASWMQNIAYDALDEVPSTEAFILRKQAQAVQASRRALSSCSEIPNSSKAVAWSWENHGRQVTVDKAFADELISDGEIVRPLIFVDTHPTSATKQAVSVPEWTDINLRQPEEYQYVLWFCQGGNIRTGMYYGKTHCDRVPETHPISRRGRSHYGKFGRYADPAESGHVVTHWMPLPDPPKQEQSQ
jgi:hypothetical protein